MLVQGYELSRYQNQPNLGVNLDFRALHVGYGVLPLALQGDPDFYPEPFDMQGIRCFLRLQDRGRKFESFRAFWLSSEAETPPFQTVRYVDTSLERTDWMRAIEDARVQLRQIAKSIPQHLQPRPSSLLMQTLAAT